MPRPDHELDYATSIPDLVTRPGERHVVLTIVEVRSDKVALDADDHERHIYGGIVRAVAHIAEGCAAYNTLTEALHQLAAGQLDQLNLFAQDDPQTPVDDGENLSPGPGEGPWEFDRPLPNTTMSPIQVDDRPPQAVKLEHLAAVDLSPAQFYAAGRRLKSGRTLADVTEGWTDDQRAYLASFLASPTTPTTTRKPRAPRKAKP